MNSIEQVEKTKNRFAYGQNGLFTVGLGVWQDIYEHENCGINEMVVFYLYHVEQMANILKALGV